MRFIIKIFSYLKYLGILGLPIFISDATIWKYLWLFWIFGILELLLTFPTFIQSLGQIFGMIITPIVFQPIPDVKNYKNKIEYSLPFKGEWLIVNGGVDRELSHSWSINSQRYAYDFVKINANLETHEGDSKKLENYFCYSDDVIAPADGVVVSVSNKCKDSHIMWNQSTDPFIKDIRGNYIIIKHIDNEYSFIGHLKPDSLLVNKGDYVNRYQKIAKCGNSGNTTEPHIHFQIQNRKSFMLSVGLPISFKNIETRKIENYEKYDPRPIESKFNYEKYKNIYIHRGLLAKNIILNKNK